MRNGQAVTPWLASEWRRAVAGLSRELIQRWPPTGRVRRSECRVHDVEHSAGRTFRRGGSAETRLSVFGSTADNQARAVATGAPLLMARPVSRNATVSGAVAERR